MEILMIILRNVEVPYILVEVLSETIDRLVSGDEPHNKRTMIKFIMGLVSAD
jgi:hypothetical protein